MWFDNHIFNLSLLFFIEVLGIINAIHAIMNARSSHGAIAWAISLVTLPYVTVPLYWILGGDTFRGYVEVYRTVDLQYQRFIQETLHGVATKYGAVLPTLLKPLQAPANAFGIPFLGGNAVTLLIDGQQAFCAILAAIDSARSYILMQYYIVHDDEIGNTIKQSLIEKAQQGVRVYFIYDEIGSHTLPDEYLEQLDEAGVQVTAFYSTKGDIRNRFQVNFRNHRKIVVVDGRTALIGGLNVGDEYLGKCAKIGHWRDTHLQIQGPAVTHVQWSFLKDWYWAIDDLPDLFWEVEKDADQDATVLILPTGPADSLPICTLFFANACHLAKQRLWIASPYFVPDEVMVAALQMAALRGVDVRILMPDKADHRLVQLASFSYYDEMLSVGVQLYRYQAGFMHQKVILIDDVMAGVGTVNLDNRSFKLNFEITAFVIDPVFVTAVTEMLQSDFAVARQVNLSELKDQRVWCQLRINLARLMSPIL